MSIRKHIPEWKVALKYYLCRFKPIEKNKIVFCNYNGKGYGCNPKYIAEELIRRHPDWDYVWLTKDLDTKLPKEIRAVKYDSPESIEELATAKVWIDNQRKLWFHRKRKKQFFVATWHGAGIPIKKIGADNPNNINNKPYEHTSKHMNNIADIMISGSESCTEIFHRAFLYKKDIINCGYPRNDILVGDLVKYQKKIREEFGIGADEKIVLYAPTYRNGRKLDKYGLDYIEVLEALKQRFGGEWKILLRLHPSMREKSKEIEVGNNVIDGSEYEDMQELLAGSDVLISDYSSVITEFALTKKPIFLFATDIREYSHERDFYCDYFALPFSVSEDNEQLKENILGFSYDNYEKNIEKCFEKFGVREYGNASSAVADIIEGVVNRK